MTESRSSATRHLGDIVTAIAVGIVVMLASATLVAGYSGYIDPRVAALAGVVYMGYPLLLDANIVAGIGALLVSRRLPLVSLAAFVLTLPAALDYCPLNFSAPAPPAAECDTISLMTYNVMMFNPWDGKYLPGGGNRTVEYILDSDVDIVVLQEIEVLYRPYAGNQLIQSQIDRLHQKYPYIIAPYDDGCYFAILSKFPIERMTPMSLPQGLYADGLAVNVKVRPDYEMTVIDLHLQSLGLTAADKELYRDMVKITADRDDLLTARVKLYDKLANAFRERARQGDYIRDYILDPSNKVSPNTIVAGDFNDVQGCYAIHAMRRDTGLESVYRNVAFGPQITYHANYFLFRIDHILYRGDMSPLSWQCDQSAMMSDHYPVTARFLIPR